MPNIRVLRKKEGKARKWTKESLEQAMQEVQSSRLSLRKAALRFGIPKSSLSDRLCGRVVHSDHSHRQIFSPEDEASLVEYCLYCASQGSPLTKSQVLAHALAVYNYRNPDKPKTVLGQTWWINFRERQHSFLASLTPALGYKRKESCVKREPDEESLHPLVTSGLLSEDLAHVLFKTSRSCNAGSIRGNTRLLTAQKMSDVIKEVKKRAARRGPQSLTGAALTVPGDSCVGCTSAPHSPSVPTLSSQRSHMTTPSNDQHHQTVEASKCWESSMSPVPLSPGSSCTTGPTTSADHVTAKKQMRERRTLRCGRCRQPHPPQDPEGLVLWVQCDNCHKMFHTICVSSEIDLDQDAFWCFWCLDD